MLVSLSGQVVVIVGASSGTGRAAAVLFAREGAKVVAAARREDRLQSLQEELAREQREITVQRADASSVEDMQQLAQAALEKFGRIDILVFASGTNTKDRAMERLTPQIWNELIDTNLNGAFYATHAILPSMRKAGSGHLIYISSISGRNTIRFKMLQDDTRIQLDLYANIRPARTYPGVGRADCARRARTAS